MTLRRAGANFRIEGFRMKYPRQSAGNRRRVVISIRLVFVTIGSTAHRLRAEWSVMAYCIFIFKTLNQWKRVFVRGALPTLAAVIVFTAAPQVACSKNIKVGIEDSGSVRLVVLPFVVSSERAGADDDLQWAAMAAPALLAKASRRLPDIEVVPFWEMMPVAISVAGASRSFTDENAESLANWLSAQWAVMGEIRRIGTSSNYTVVVDFIPAKTTLIPYRHIKKRRMENIGTAFYAGLRQWMRYVTTRQIPLQQVRESGLQSMRHVGEALDKEYGWLVSAEPGAAQPLIDEFIENGDEWTKLLFSPTMYPQLHKEPVSQAIRGN